MIREQNKRAALMITEQSERAKLESKILDSITEQLSND